MLKLLLLPMEILLGAIFGILGYNFLRWLVDKVTFGRATKKFDQIKYKWTLGQFGQLIFIVGFFALFILIARISK